MVRSTFYRLKQRQGENKTETSWKERKTARKTARDEFPIVFELDLGSISIVLYARCI